MSTATKVINIEDTMPYVEPVKVKTSVDFFKESLADSAEAEMETAQYYRSKKEWGKAALHQRTGTELERIARCADPAREIDDSMERAIRLYADLKLAVADAHAHTVWGMKKQATAMSERAAENWSARKQAETPKALEAPKASASDAALGLIKERREASAPKPVNVPKARHPRVRRGTGAKSGSR